MALLRNIFWAAVFLGATFCFTVLFEYGPANFTENAKKEAQVLKALAGMKIEKPKDASDHLTPPLN